jgi:hypothetical protein
MLTIENLHLEPWGICCVWDIERGAEPKDFVLTLLLIMVK